MDRTTNPFFVRPGTGTPDRLLLISYHFPPGHEAGALRWQKFARYAQERGWTLDVVTVAPNHVPDPELDRLAELPPGTRVFGIPSQSHPLDTVDRRARQAIRFLMRRFRSSGNGTNSPSETLYESTSERIESVMRSSMFSPRAAIRGYNAWLWTQRNLIWGRRAARAAAHFLDPGTHRAIISCGPPHEAHCAAAELSARHGLPFIMDMRDTWSLISRLESDFASPVYVKLARRLERRTIEQASLIVLVTDLAHTRMQAAYPTAHDKFITVMNGYDEEPVPQMVRRDRFVVAYAGGIYLDRDPQPLLRAAKQVVRELQLGPGQFSIEFMGHSASYGGVPLHDIAAQEGLNGYLTLHQPRPRAEVLKFLAGASVLVSLPQDTHDAIPSKLFQHMQFDAWVLVLAAQGSATHLLMRSTTADVIDPNDVEGISDCLRRRYGEYTKGIRPNPICQTAPFSRRNEATKLFDRLEFLHRRHEEADPARQV